MTALTIQLPQPLSRAQSARLQSTLNQLAPAILARQEEENSQQLRKLVDVLAGSFEPEPLNMQRALLQVKAMKAVYAGTEWLTATQVGELFARQSGRRSVNPSAAASRWKNSGAIFAIEFDGRDRYPRYAFGLDFRPLAEMAEIISIMKPIEALKLSAWFESNSSFLGGKKPREVIGQDARRVVDAALDSKAQLEH